MKEDIKEDEKEEIKEEVKEEIKEDIQEDIQEDIKEKGASKVEKLTKLNRQATHVELEDTELSPDTQNAESTLDPEVLTNAQNTNLFEYEQAHLDSRHHGILKGFKAMTPDEIIQWQNELITKPLLRLPSSLEEISIQLFKNLVSYMGDRKSSKNPHLHIVKHSLKYQLHLFFFFKAGLRFLLTISIRIRTISIFKRYIILAWGKKEEMK